MSVAAWVSVLLFAVVGLLVREVMVARRWERRVIVLADPRTQGRQRALRLQGVGWLAIFLSAAQRHLYRTARVDWLVNVFTIACVVLGIVLVAKGWALTRKLRQ